MILEVHDGLTVELFLLQAGLIEEVLEVGSGRGGIVELGEGAGEVLVGLFGL